MGRDAVRPLADLRRFRRLVVIIMFATVVAFPAVGIAQEASVPGPAGAAAAPVVIVPGLGDGMGILDLAAEGDPAADKGTLPHDLSPWGMFLAADMVVKAVMIGLAFASVVTWTICLAKFLELAMARRRVRRSAASLARAASLEQAREVLGRNDLIGQALVGAAETELSMSNDIGASDGGKAGIKERVSSRLDRIEAAIGRRMIRGTGVLATIGSTSPFVGLFGTVWGIMNSFIGISESQTTNLAVVAPGIAEALLATAIGLVAAIPAVVIYNHFARQITGYRALVADITAEVMRLVSRDLDRAGILTHRYARAAE